METIQPRNDFIPGGGAQFWGYISGMMHTPEVVTKWRIHLEHTTSDWCGDITSDNPMVMLKTPELSGTFTVTVTASGPNFQEKKLTLLDDPTISHNPDIECKADNAGMIGIVAAQDGQDAQYWTISNAYHRR